MILGDEVIGVCSGGAGGDKSPAYKQRPMNGAESLHTERLSPVQGALLLAQRFNAARYLQSVVDNNERVTAILTCHGLAGFVVVSSYPSGYVAVETAPQYGVSPADSAGCQADLALHIRASP